MKRLLKRAIQRLLRAVGYKLVPLRSALAASPTAILSSTEITSEEDTDPDLEEDYIWTTKIKDVFAVQQELILGDEPVIFDIGAHTGAVTRFYRNLFPSAIIHCFEPFPASLSHLQDLFAEDEGIFCHPFAIANHNGSATLNANQSSLTNSLLPTDQQGETFWGKGLLDTVSHVDVTTTTLDTFCERQGIAHIDILKLDVQGAEFSVFEGAQQLLADQQVSLIYTELITCPTYIGQHKLHEYLAFLDALGYELLDFFNPYRCRNQLIQADVVLISRKLKQQIHASP